jgi:hypothetical protein
MSSAKPEGKTMKTFIACIITALVTAGASFGAASKFLIVKDGDQLVTHDGKVACVVQRSAGYSFTCGRVKNSSRTYTATVSALGVTITRGNRIVWIRLNP